MPSWEGQTRKLEITATRERQGSRLESRLPGGRDLIVLLRMNLAACGALESLREAAEPAG